MSFFDRLKEGLQKTRNSITAKIDQTLAAFGKVDEELFEQLEEDLISSDVGVDATLKILKAVRERAKTEKIAEPQKIKDVLKEEIIKILGEKIIHPDSLTKPKVIVVIGVNGVGKTTTIGKIAHKLTSQHKKVIIAAADTFRAAAVDQLDIWVKRAGADLIRHAEGADPGAVVFDSAKAAMARGADVLICDTAGRLHTKKNLMEELKKIFKILNRELPDSEIETLLVLDATTGQNAVSQAKTFSEAAEISGIVLTKLDGTAKGGIIIAINAELKIPVKMIGVGETVEDLQDFDSKEFVEALFS